MAPIARAGCSPETAPEIFSTASFTAPALPISRLHRTSLMASCCKMPISPQRCVARPRTTSRFPRSCANCAGYLEKEFELLKPRAVLALGAIAFHAYLRLLVQGRNDSSRALRTGLPMARNSRCPQICRFFSPAIIPASRTRRPDALRRRCFTEFCCKFAAPLRSPPHIDCAPLGA